MGFEKKCENDYLEIWFKEDIASIRVVDKRSGYVWGSLEEDTHEDLNDSLAAMANSICTIEYYDENGTETISVVSPYFVPTITHYDYNYSNVRNYMLWDYTPELAAKHGVKPHDNKFSYDYIESIVYNVIPEEFLLYK